MSNMESKKMLMKKIMMVSFAINDLALFLDTHPNCMEALEHYKELKKKRKELVDKYTYEYGPLCQYNVHVDSCWDWNKGPMPWEGDDC